MKTFVLIILVVSYGTGSGNVAMTSGYTAEDCRTAKNWYLKLARADNWQTSAYCIPGPLVGEAP